MKCPACGFANEDGVLFCDQCKADLEMPPAAPPAQVPTPMNEPSASPETPSAEEPIPLEPITLEPVGDISAAGAGSSDQAPIELEPVDQRPTTEEPGVSDTAHGTQPDAPPPLPGTGGALTNPKLIVVRGQRIDV